MIYEVLYKYHEFLKGMKLLTLNQFLSRFERGDNLHTFAHFRKHARVRIGKKIVPLTEYLAKAGTRTMTQQTKIMRVVYSLIEQKEQIVENFYKTSLDVSEKFVPSTLMEYPPMPLSRLSNATYPKYKNLIRNIHYLGILKTTTSDIPNVRPYLDVMEDLFKRWIIDYKLVTPSAIHYFSQGVVGSILSAYTFRASVMNPYLVYSVLSRLATSMRLRELSLFTPTLGWSSYLVGASQLSIPLVKYTGIDVLSSVCRRTAQLAETILPSTDMTIYCKPSETIARTSSIVRAHRGQYDIVFFSPPYYKLEKYGKVMDGYTSFQDWIEAYWIPTIGLCHTVLKRGGRLVFILGLYGQVQDELTHMLSVPKTCCGFKGMRSYPIANSRTMNQSYHVEHLYVFEK